MAQIKRARPSPAILVSVIALVAALGGSAVAEVATTAKLSKKEKKEVGKIAKGKANKQTSDIDDGFVMAPDGKWLGIDGESTALGVNYAGAKCVLAGVVNAAG